MKRGVRIAVLVGIVCWMSLIGSLSIPLAADEASGVPEVPAKDMVTMVDIGAGECIPCKMMAPIIESLEKEYSGKAAIVFIDVWKNKDQGKRFAIRSIPTQIFYDKSGNEAYRHEGFLDKGRIMSKLEELGVKLEAPAPSAESDR